MAWQIDSAHSHIHFSIRHLMIAKVRGSFDKFDGTIDFDEEHPSASKVEIEIDAASINTKDEQRDGHLMSPDFLDVEKFPVITFKSVNVHQIDESSGHVHGELTVRDITKEVTLDVEYSGQAQNPWGATVAGFSGKTTIDRRDWDIHWNQALETGGFLVGDRLNVEIELELVQQAEEEAA
jgi:polyisoprenoid-binding protein YceI